MGKNFLNSLLLSLFFSFLTLSLLNTISFSQQVNRQQTARTQARRTAEQERQDNQSYEDLYRIYKSAGMTDIEIEGLLLKMGLERPTDFEIPVLTYPEMDSLQVIFRNMQIKAVYDLQETMKLDSVSVGEMIKKLRIQIDSLSVMKHFGYDFFKSEMGNLGRITGGPVIPGYPLGPGDELIIDLWGGSTQRHFEQTITRAGNIFIEDVGLIQLANLTLSEAENVLRREISKYYSGLAAGSVNLNVTLGANREIIVWVNGEVNISGRRLISSLSSPIEPLHYSGGPTEKGSLRNIRIMRGGKVVGEIDFYDFMLNGIHPDIRLQDNDVINVPIASKTVTVTGQIRRPAIYEVKDNESLEDLMKIAGGIKANAARNRIQIKRIVSESNIEFNEGDLRYIEIYPDQDGSFRSTDLKDGDEIHIPPINEIEQGYVNIEGSVRRPGTYMYQRGLSLNMLIDRAQGVTPFALLERGEIIRTNPDSTHQSIPFSLSERYPNRANENIQLQNLDRITVFSKRKLRVNEYITVLGAVKNPGEQLFAENMTLKDAILRAGGFKEGALQNEAELSRRIPGTNTNEIITIALGDGFSITNSDFKLEKYDQVSIKRDPDWEEQKTVVILGEVNIPGRFSLQEKNETFFDLLERSGGFKETAYPGGIVYTRKDKESDEGFVRIGLDINKILKNRNSSENITLVGGDSVFVPKFTNLVQVQGEVGLPSSVLFKQGEGYKYYLERAGGLTATADKGRIQIILANGHVGKPKRFRPDPIITPGTVIYVPREVPGEGLNWNQIFSTVIQLSSAVITIIAVSR